MSDCESSVPLSVGSKDSYRCASEGELVLEEKNLDCDSITGIFSTIPLGNESNELQSDTGVDETQNASSVNCELIVGQPLSIVDVGQSTIADQRHLSSAEPVFDNSSQNEDCCSGVNQSGSEKDVTSGSSVDATSNETSHVSSASSLSSLSLRETEKFSISEETDELKKLCIHLQSILDKQLKERERILKKNEELSQQVQSLKEANTLSLQHDQVENGHKQQSAEVASLRKELEATKMILETQGSKFNKEIALLTSTYTVKLDTLTRSYEECKKEKETMVIKYAQSESKNIELQGSCRRADAKVREYMKERDAAVNRWNNMKTDNSKIHKLLEAKESELGSLKRECDGQREATSSKDLQVKFLQQKIKQEQDATKDAREKVQDMMQQSSSVRTDCECLLNELKALLQANQVLQLTGSLPTLAQATGRIELIVRKKTEDASSKELWAEIFENLLALVVVVGGLMADNLSLKEKAKRTNQELSSNEEDLTRRRREFEELEAEMSSLRMQLQEVETRNRDDQTELLALRESDKKSGELEKTNRELESEMEIQSTRHEECLEYANRLSQVYASLQAENIRLNSEIETLRDENKKFGSKCADLEVENKQLIEQRMVGLKDSEGNMAAMEMELEKKKTENCLLNVKLSEVEDDLKSLRRQSAARIKDLGRQLQKLNKNLRFASDAPEYDSSGSSNFSDNGLLPLNHPLVNGASRTSDFPDQDRDKLPFMAVSSYRAPSKPGGKKISFELDCDRRGTTRADAEVEGRLRPLYPRVVCDDPEVLCDDVQGCEDAEVGYSSPSVRIVEVNKQMLIDKIVSLQKTLAKKNERMDFLQELNLRLSEDVSSKAKIIQNYILKEETGVMSTNQSDKLKMQMSKRGGIMASLFSSQPQDEAMTVDLALEISHKLQSVLEDTLLKNIALKESIELLGQQVAKLSKENK